MTTLTHLEDNYKEFYIARPLRIILARLVDIILANIIPFVLTLTVKSWHIDQQWLMVLILILTTLFIFIGYFVIIPYYWDGQTVGKFIFGIKLVCVEHKLSLFNIFAREFFIIFIPWFTLLITNLILTVILKVNLQDLVNKSENSIGLVVIRIMWAFYFLWYMGLILTLCLNENHQVLFDFRFSLYVIKKKPKIEKQKIQNSDNIITRNKEHVHLGYDQPGNIDEQALDDIENL